MVAERPDAVELEDLLRYLGDDCGIVTVDPTQIPGLDESLDFDLLVLDIDQPSDDRAAMDLLAVGPTLGRDVPILALTVDPTSDRGRRALLAGLTDFLVKPFDPVEARTRIAALLGRRFLQMELTRQKDALEEKVRVRTEELWATINRLERAHQDVRLAQEETITSLSIAAELRDDETSRHIERMSSYCAIVARGLELGDHLAETMRLAAKMHDIGKIGVPESIVTKPARLSAAEFGSMKRHCEIGMDILRGATSELAVMAASIAWTHHERIDGSGYPRRLVGEQIPLEGRVAAVADVFDALTTDRNYRKAFTLTGALNMIKQGRGSLFDEAVTDTFMDHIDEVLGVKEAFEDLPG